MAPIRTAAGVELRGTGTDLASQTQKNVLRLVRQCLDEAIRRELIATNPGKLVKAARDGRRADLADAWLRAEEIDALLSCGAISLRDRTAYACAIGLGLRLNDLKSLRLSDVDLDAQVPGPAVRLVIEKTGKPHRVPVLPWLEPWLRAHLATLPRGSGLLFPGPDGDCYGRFYDFAWAEKRDRARDHVRPSALALAGVQRRIRFHDLRGTTATHLALATWGRSWTLHEIQRMLAHADSSTTERYVRRAHDLLAIAARETPGGPSVVAPGCPGHAPFRAAVGAPAAPESPSKPPIRFERTTYGLRNRCSTD